MFINSFIALFLLPVLNNRGQEQRLCLCLWLSANVHAEVSSAASGLEDESLVLLRVECELKNNSARELSQNELPV